MGAMMRIRAGWVAVAWLWAATVAAAPARDAGLDRVATLARAAAVIRYLHPSDQAAALDWNAFLPGAVDRVLAAPDQAALLGELRRLFARIAPTAVFSPLDRPPAVRLPRGAGTHLARWRRYGPGAPSPFPSFREGRDAETDVAVSEVIAVPLDRGCEIAKVTARVRRLTPTGTVDLVLRMLQAGQEVSVIPWPITRSGRVVVSAAVRPGTQSLELGLMVDSRAGATLESLTLACPGHPDIAIDPAAAAWQTVGPTDLTSWRVGRCNGGPCATLARHPLDRAWLAERDLVGADIGSGLRLDLPLAVWADAARTLPAVPDPTGGAGSPISAASSDRAMRLAAVAAAWGTLAIFYPYFRDQHIEWSAALGPALAEAAAARDPAELRVALRHLLAELRDGHARLSDPAAVAAGALPIALRRFGDRIVVTGAADEPELAGSELVALDGVPALAAFDRVAAQVSAATEGLRSHLAASAVVGGPTGALRQLGLRGRDGISLARALTLRPRELTDRAARPTRPWPGTELAPGVVYVDFDELTPETWRALLPTLVAARALVFDFRGYSTTSLVALPHLIDHPIDQLLRQVPQLPEGARPPYAVERHTLDPIAPRLAAPVVALVDGQAASVVEETLALFHAHHLGMLIGETTAGTSGLISHFTVPGGLAIRFTAIRLVDAAGATLHGRGITPDLVVVPTLTGARAGRDEILEAGLFAAQQLARRSAAP